MHTDSPTPPLRRVRRAIARAIEGKDAAGGADSGVERATVPQSIRSEEHNLAEERTYRSLLLPGLARSRKENVAAAAQCEHFSAYGGEGHDLTYFRKNRNIPTVIYDNALAPHIATLEEVAEAADTAGTAVRGLEWRMTLNAYRPVTESAAPVSLFPWHIDIAQNGHLTAILTLGRPGCIQYAASAEYLDQHPDTPDLPTESNPLTIDLDPGSILVSSGDSRWHFLHRVIPSQQPLDADPPHAIVGDPDGAQRYSLVFGCQ